MSPIKNIIDFAIKSADPSMLGYLIAEENRRLPELFCRLGDLFYTRSAEDSGVTDEEPAIIAMIRETKANISRLECALTEVLEGRVPDDASMEAEKMLEPEPQPEPGDIPEPVFEPEPEPQPEPVDLPEPVFTAEPEPQPEPVDLPEPVFVPETVPQPVIEPAPAVIPDDDPLFMPEQIPVPEPDFEPLPASDPLFDIPDAPVPAPVVHDFPDDIEDDADRTMAVNSYWHKEQNNPYEPAPAVQPAEPAPEPVKSFCTGCGSSLLPGAAFCLVCGKKVSHPVKQPQPQPAFAEPQAQKPVEPPVQPPFTPPAPPAAPNPPQKRFCTRCGKQLVRDTPFCPSCGAKLH